MTGSRRTGTSAAAPVISLSLTPSWTLPIDYYENANGLILRGENLDGSVSQLVFYSARGMQRMQDLTGKGPDEDPCGSHKKK